MNSQQSINHLQQLQESLPPGELDGPLRFIDNVNTQLIDAMLVLEATFLNEAPVVNVAAMIDRIAAVHALVQSAWNGSPPIAQAQEVVASIKSSAIIGDAMRGPQS